MKKFALALLFMFFIVLPVIFWAAALTSGLPRAVYVHEVGKLLGLIGFVLLLFQYVLSSKIKWIERGIGLDVLFRVHRKAGLIALILIIAHPTLLFISERLQGYVTPLSILKVLGLVALLLLLLAAGAALLYGVLPLKYETWKGIHKTAYAIFLLAFIHSFFIGSDLQRWPMRIVWIILAILFAGIVAYKLQQRSYRRRYPFRVAGVLQETYDTWSVQFEGEHPPYNPGQFMIIQLVRDGNISEPHPFTISSSPTRERLSISVKSVGDFTSTIDQTNTTDMAYIDMPYGVFSFLNFDALNLVFIAGGIGITPFMSMLRYLYDKKLKKNVILLWGNKTEQDIAFRKELEAMASEMPTFKVVHVLSRQESWTGERGTINADVLKRYVDTFYSSQFFICGPPPMMRAVERTLTDLGAPKNRIHYERFALR
jgi:predicted ferric reductase